MQALKWVRFETCRPTALQVHRYKLTLLVISLLALAATAGSRAPAASGSTAAAADIASQQAKDEETGFWLEPSASEGRQPEESSSSRPISIFDSPDNDRSRTNEKVVAETVDMNESDDQGSAELARVQPEKAFPYPVNDESKSRKYSLFNDLTRREQPLPQSLLKVRVHVPHNKQAVDTFTAYPFPVKPPVVKWPKPLPTRTGEIKSRLMDSGYVNRQSGRKPHPTFGWRWQRAYESAVRKSRMGVPHTIATAYPWANSMLRYILPEIRAINAMEEERQARYQRIIDDHDKKRVQVENQAAQSGLYPMELKRMPGYVAQARVPAGNWWIVGTHKVSGLTYYWNLPVTVYPQQPANVVLTEANALLIQGAW